MQPTLNKYMVLESGFFVRIFGMENKPVLWTIKESIAYIILKMVECILRDICQRTKESILFCLYTVNIAE